MKFTASLNLQNHNWNGIKNHVNRHFEDSKNGTHKDVNLNHINQNLSKYNLSSDGKLIDKHGHKKFIIKSNPLIHNFKQSLNKTYSTYIKKHNQSKSVKRHPKRRITDLFNQKLMKKATKRDKKHDPTAQTKLDTYSKTLVQNIGNTDLNQKIIHKLMKLKHWNYSKARNNFIQIGSEMGSINASQFNQFHNHLHLLHYATNVDETSDKQKRKPDSIHTHYVLIGTTFTKLDKNFKPIQATTTTDKKGKMHHHRGAKPSFSFARALCNEEHIPYRKKTIKVKAHNKNGYKRVNASYHKALSKFRTKQGMGMITSLNIGFKTIDRVNLHLTYYQTGQKVNGLSMNAERKRQQTKHLKQAIIKRHRQLGAKRSRHLSHLKAKNRKYYQHLAYLRKRKYQIKKSSASVSTKSEVVNQKSNQVAYNQISYSNSANDFANQVQNYYSQSASSYGSYATNYLSSFYKSSANSVLEPQIKSISSASNSVNDTRAKLITMKSTINEQLKNRTALDYQMRKQQLLFNQRHKAQEKHYQQLRGILTMNNYQIANQQNVINHKQFQSQNLTKTINHKQNILNSITSQFSRVRNQIKSYETNFDNFTQNIIQSTKQTLKQTAHHNLNNVEQLQSANAKQLSNANHKLSSQATKSKLGLFGGIKSLAHQWHSNYQSNKVSKSAKVSYQSSLNSTYSSIAEPVVLKHERWEQETDSLYEKSKEPQGLWMNELDKYKSLMDNEPPTVSQYSNSIQSKTGMNLIQSSKSSASSLSKAMPSIKASEASQSRVWASESKAHSVQISINNRSIDRSLSISEKVDREVSRQENQERNRWIISHPKQFKEWQRNHQAQGPTWQ